MPRNIYKLSMNKNEPIVTNRKSKPICFLPLCYYQKHCGKGKKDCQKGTARTKTTKKMYPKLLKAATHTSSKTDLIRTKKKHDADEADQGVSGWVGR